MSKAARLLALYAAAFCAVLLAVDPGEDAGLFSFPQPLPVEVVLSGEGPVCGAPETRLAMSEAFRWLTGKEGPVWKHRLTAHCVETADFVKLSYSLGGKPAGVVSVKRAAPAPAAALAWQSWLDDAVSEASIRAFLANQSDVARAGADLWRLGRWNEAVATLFAALENDWAEGGQAQLHYGLADSYAHLGRPRQAYWHALAYLSASPGVSPPEDWAKRLRGLSSLAAEAPPGVDPQTAEALRRYRAAQARRERRETLDALRELARAAPWAADYQDALASVYEGAGWAPLAESWRRRAALSRRLASDAALQTRLAELTR